jgi:hypothetical protein
MLKKLLYITPIISILLVSCARQLSPSGGPEDKSSPIIKLSSPASSSLNVPPNSKIEIIFSEWVSKKGNNIVSIYPPLRNKVSINKNRLQIVPLDAMADSQTYHVIISSNLQDLHGNSLPTSYSLVFSTGGSLDSGIITGCIIDPENKSKRYQVALFRNDNFSDSGYNGTPSYKIESDTLGKYQFDFIKMGIYRIVAYVNASQNAKNDIVYTPVDSISPVMHRSDTVNLYPSRVDTAFPVISSIKCENWKFAYGVWSKNIDTSVFKFSVHLFGSDSLGMQEPVRYIMLGSERQFALLPKQPFTIAPWKCIYSVSRIFDTIVFTDTLLFNSTNREDTVKPVVKSWLPTGDVDIHQKLYLVWSEPVQLDSSLFLFDTLGDTVYCKTTFGYRDTSVLIPLKALKMDALYKLILFAKNGKDLFGNTLKTKDTSSADTVAIIKFETIESDSISISISGETECPTPDMPSEKKWIFELFRNKTRYISKLSANQTFFFDSLPAGLGNVSVFLDRNNNNQPDPGVLIPWKSPEPFISFSDTVEARARWEVEGIKLAGCRNCFKNPADTVNIDSANVTKKSR